MSTKAVRITYWVLLVLFCLMILGDAYGGLSHQQAGIDALKQIGFPVYLLTFFGMLKVLGVIALLQNKFKAIKDWAFAGFFFNFLGAAWARASTNGGTFLVILPLVFVVIVLVLYFLWRRLEKVDAA